MEQIIEALRPFGDVLEIGFGASSTQIQKYHPRTHTIIEPHPHEAEKGRQWAKKHPTAKIIEENWASILPQLGSFDTIFFGLKSTLHDHPLVEEGKKLVRSVQETFDLIKIRYSDRDLEAFCASVGAASKLQLSQFLAELEENGQITQEQLKKMAGQFKLKIEKPKRQNSGETLSFFLQCYESHLRKGGRFASLTPLHDLPASFPTPYKNVIEKPL